MARKQRIGLEWKKNRLVDSETGLDAIVIKTFPPKHYDLRASASLPLMLQVDTKINGVIRGDANAYTYHEVCTEEGDRWSSYRVTITPYQVELKKR